MTNLAYRAHDNIMSTHFDFHYGVSRVSEVETNYHYHDFYEVFLFIKGKVNFVIEGRQYDLQPGNILLIHYHDLHQAILYNAERYERFYIWIDPAFFEKNSTHKTKLDLCFSNLNGRRSRILNTTLADIEDFYPRLIELQQAQEFGSDIRIHNLLLELLIFINLCFIDQEEELWLKHVKENPLIRNVIDYVRINLNQKIKLDTLAAAFFVSKAHLSREFKKFTGFTLHAYILKTKLLYSKKLLLEGNSAKEVYHQCGFVNYSHFIKAFKAEFKITPKNFQLLEIEKNGSVAQFKKRQHVFG